MYTDETELPVQISRGDQKAFEHVFRAYYQPLSRYASGLLGDRDAAEEVVQQLFCRLWEKRENFQVSGSLKSYLFRAVHNAVMNEIKHEKVKQAYMQNQVHDRPQQEQPGSALQAKELEGKIQAAIGELPEHCRHVFRLSRFEGLSYREIAEVLGISVKTVENQMGKALKTLRIRLAEYLHLLPVFILLFS
ncbi:MAG: RNA polymerase, sigma-24 subunit, ECF subfamily [Bacteroidetes bacterium]|nr:MAG: RNA polymerase, sigma-24 subunit, ECF subfamily [Bacteroidota bacterium]